MKRVIIVGAPGSGKSTLARGIAGKTGLPITHLDSLYFDPQQRYNQHRTAWAQRLSELAAADSWIIEGCHAVDLAPHAARADVIILLDYPRRVIVWRIMSRFVKQRGGDPPEMPEGWREVFDTNARRWWFELALNFPRTFKHELAVLLKPTAGKQRLILSNPAQAKTYLNAMIEP